MNSRALPASFQGARQPGAVGGRPSMGSPTDPTSTSSSTTPTAMPAAGAGRAHSPGLLRHVLLLSPANCSGRRGAMLRRPGATSALAGRLRQGDLPLGEAFTFISGLYFRGKLAYARARCDARGAEAACFVI